MRLGFAIIGLVVAATAALSGGSADAAGFNCSVATTVTERTICGDPALSAKDDELTSEYRSVRSEALKLNGGDGPIIAAQRAWIKRANACGADTSCLSASYDSRLVELKDESDRIHSLDAPSSSQGANYQPNSKPDSSTPAPTAAIQPPAKAAASDTTGSARTAGPTLIGIVIACVLTVLTAVLSPIAWGLGEAVRRFAMPDATFVTGGFWALVRTRIFWQVGPQFIALGLLWTAAGYAIVFALQPPAQSSAQQPKTTSAVPGPGSLLPAKEVTGDYQPTHFEAGNNVETPPATAMPSNPEAASEPEHASPHNDPRLLAAIEASLSEGSSKPWSDDKGGRGMTSVSTAQKSGDKECRNYRFTSIQSANTATYEGSACRDSVAAPWVLTENH